MIMMRLKISLFLVYVFYMPLSYAASFCNGTPKHFILTPNINVENINIPIDSVTYPIQIGSSTYYSENVLFDYCWPYYMREQARIMRPVMGQYNGQDVYDIGIPHVGMTFTIADSQEGGFVGGIPMTGNNKINVVPNYDHMYLIPRVGASIKIGVIVMDRYPIGIIRVPPIKVGEFSIVSSNNGVNSLGGVSDIILNSFNIEVNSKTCNLSQRNYTVPLQAVYKNQFPDVNSEVFGGSVKLQLYCQSDIDVFATLTDTTNPANYSTILSLSETSSAKGIGLRLYKNGSSEALNFGPDSAVKGNINQWKVSQYRGELSPAVNLTVNYIRRGNINPGTVYALSTITFSYQ